MIKLKITTASPNFITYLGKNHQRMLKTLGKMLYVKWSQNIPVRLLLDLQRKKATFIMEKSGTHTTQIKVINFSITNNGSNLNYVLLDVIQ